MSQSSDPYYLKEKENIKEYFDAKSDPLGYTKNYYKNSFGLNRLLSHLKKQFKIVPATLKANESQKAKELYPLALYLLAHYCKEDVRVICKEFNISNEDFDSIKKDINIKEKFKIETDAFFQPFIQDCLSNLYTNLALKEELENAITFINKQ